MEQSGLRLLTLGRVELLGAGTEGESLNRRRRKLALLALLALERRPVPRERLIEMFWGAQPEPRARHSLSDAISHLRRVLGASAIISHRHGLALNPAIGLSIDVVELERAAGAGEWARVAALDGGSFLAGVAVEASTSFDEWVAREAARVRAIAAGAYRDGCERLASAGAWQEALDVAARWREAAPGSTKARRFEERARTALAEHCPLPSEPPACEELLVSWRVASAGAPQLVVVAGDVDARIGASRAMRHVAAAEGAAVISMRITSAESVEPLHLVRELAAALLEAPGCAGADPAHVAALRRLVPDTDPPTAPDGVHASTLTDALRGTLESVAYESPLLVAIDDAHLADAASLEVLRVALRQVSGPLMTLVSAPAETGAGGGALARMAGSATRVRLNAPPREGATMTVRTRSGWSARLLAMPAAAAVLLLAVTLALPRGAVTGTSPAARRLYDDGLRAYFAGRHDQARPLFDAALREDSTFAMAAHYAALARGSHDADARRRALRLADRATDRERLMIRAWWLGETDDPRGAAAAETLAVRYPDEVQGLLLYGRALESRGDFASAITWFRRALARDSASLRGGTTTCHACSALGLIRNTALFAGSFQVAEDAARRLVATHPGGRERASAWLEVALVLARDLRLTAAQAAVDSALRADPSIDPAYVRLHIAIRAGRLDAAEGMLRAGIEQVAPPVRFDRLRHLVAVLRLQGRHTEAIATARHARSLGDSLGVGFSEAARLLAVAQLATEPRAAAALFDSIAARPFLPPDFPARNARQRAWMLTHVATALANAGDTVRLARLADSVQALGALSSYERDRRLHLYVRALLVGARGDAGGTATLLRLARYSPTENHLAVRLARAELAAGEPRAAIMTAQAALRGPLDSQNQYEMRSELLEVLGDAYAAVGDQARAAEHYRATAAAWARADGPWRERGARAAGRAARLAGVARG